MCVCVCVCVCARLGVHVCVHVYVCAVCKDVVGLVHARAYRSSDGVCEVMCHSVWWCVRDYGCVIMCICDWVIHPYRCARLWLCIICIYCVYSVYIVCMIYIL